MKREVSKLVRRRFAERLKHRLPKFSKVKVINNPHCEVYASKTESLSLFVCLYLSPKSWHDRFTVELGWSRSGEFPSDSLSMRRGERPTANEELLRLAALRPEQGETDYWWDVKYSASRAELDAWLATTAETANEELDDLALRVYPRVDEAVEEVVKFGLPYFEDVAQRVLGQMPPKAHGE